MKNLSSISSVKQSLLNDVLYNIQYGNLLLLYGIFHQQFVTPD